VAERQDDRHVEFDEKECHDPAVEVAFQRGLLYSALLGCEYRTLQVFPPLDVTEHESEIGADLLVERACRTRSAYSSR
jgi:4-aminobutyrate aminotransferase-like enzyme